MSNARRITAAITSGLVALIWLPMLAGSAQAADPVLVPDSTINGCNGVLPTPGSANTTKRLDPNYPSDFEPGGVIGYIIDFPVDAGDVGGNFEITDCVYVDPPGAGADVAIAKYFINFVPNNTSFQLHFTVPIPADTPLGSQFCNYAKTTASPSASQASNRKAGPACFTVGGGLRIEKRAGSATGALLGGASFSVVCAPTTTLPPTIITGLSNQSVTNGNGTVSASGVATDGAIAINGPSGTPCTVTETAAPDGYVVDATPRNLVIPIGTSQTINVFVNQRVTGSLVVQKSTDEDGTFNFDVDCSDDAFDTTLTITTSGGSGSAAISGMPTGTTCTVTEQDNLNFSSVVIPADGQVTIAAGDNTVSFTNLRRRGSLVIAKSADQDGTFTFDVDCTGVAFDAANVSITTVNGTGSATISGIPTGTVCTVTEDADASWAVTVDPADGTVTISGTPATVSFTNTKLFTDVSLGKSADPASGTAVTDGDTITYTLAYANAGNIAADVTITDAIPAGTTYVDGSAGDGVLADGVLSWDRTVPAAGSGSVSFQVTVDADLADPTTIRNVAVLQVGDEETLTNETEHPVAHVDIAKAVDKDEAEFGDSLTYTLTVSNPSAAALTGVVVTDPMPAGATFVSASDGGTCDDPCTTVTWPAVDLAAGASFERTFVVTVDSPVPAEDGGIPGTVIVNAASVDSNETVEEPSNEVRTVITAVLGVKVIKRPLPATGAPLSVPKTTLLGIALLLAGAGLTFGPAWRERLARSAS